MRAMRILDLVEPRTLKEVWERAKEAREALIADQQRQFEELSGRQDIQLKLALIKVTEAWLASTPSGLYGMLGDDLIASCYELSVLSIDGKGRFYVPIIALGTAELFDPEDLDHLRVLEEVDVDKLALAIAVLTKALGIADPTFE